MKLLTTLAIPTLFLAFNGQPDAVKTVQPTFKTEAVYAATKVTFGTGITLIVKGLGLNIDNIRFIKAPKATDYVTKANNKASYAESIIIAASNGIKLSRAMNPEAAMTRADFAVSLLEAINSTGQYAVNMMWININDQKNFPTNASSSAVQTLIKFNVVALEKGNFRPKALITSAEANKMVKQAAAFVKSHKENTTQQADQEVTLQTVPVNQEINRVVLSRGSKPNSGYQISVTSIEFSNDEARVHYKLIDPTAGNSYMQVITEPKAETFIPSKYKVVIRKDR